MMFFLPCLFFSMIPCSSSFFMWALIFDFENPVFLMSLSCVVSFCSDFIASMILFSSGVRIMLITREDSLILHLGMMKNFVIRKLVMTPIPKLAKMVARRL